MFSFRSSNHARQFPDASNRKWLRFVIREVDHIVRTASAVFLIGLSAVSVFRFDHPTNSEGLVLLLPLWACRQRCVVHHVHSFIAKLAACAFAPHNYRRLVAKRPMGALAPDSGQAFKVRCCEL